MKYKVPKEILTSSLKSHRLDREKINNYKVKKEREDKIIDFVRWNQSIEGFDMPPEDEEECRKIIRGEITIDESIDKFLALHGLKRNNQKPGK